MWQESFFQTRDLIVRKAQISAALGSTGCRLDIHGFGHVRRGKLLLKACTLVAGESESRFEISFSSVTEDDVRIAESENRIRVAVRRVSCAPQRTQFLLSSKVIVGSYCLQIKGLSLSQDNVPHQNPKHYFKEVRATPIAIYLVGIRLSRRHSNCTDVVASWGWIRSG